MRGSLHRRMYAGPLPATVVGLEIHGDLVLLALDGHLGCMPAAGAGSCITQGDVLLPREQHGAQAAGRALGAVEVCLIFMVALWEGVAVLWAGRSGRALIC